MPFSILDDEPSMFEEKHTASITTLSSSLQFPPSSSWTDISQSSSTVHLSNSFSASQLSSSFEPLAKTGATRLQPNLSVRPSSELSPYVTTCKELNDQARQEAQANYKEKHGEECNQQNDTFRLCHLKKKRNVKDTLICRHRRKLYVNKLEWAVTSSENVCMQLSGMTDKIKGEIKQMKQLISNAESRDQPATAYSQSAQILPDNSLLTSSSSSDSPTYMRKPYQDEMIDTDTFELCQELSSSYDVPSPPAVEYTQMDSPFPFNLENLQILSSSPLKPGISSLDELGEESQSASFSRLEDILDAKKSTLQRESDE